MGLGVSKPEDPQAKHQRELQKRGVLIPPSFGVVNCDPVLSSSLLSLQNRLPLLVPSLLHDLTGQDTSNRILNDYLQTGFWLSSTTSDNSSVKTSFRLKDTTTRGHAPSGLIALQHSSNPNNFNNAKDGTSTSTTRLCMGTDGSPSVTTSLQLLPSFSVIGHADTTGRGWIGTHMDLGLQGKRDSTRLRLGSWLAGSLKTTATTTKVQKPTHGSITPKAASSSSLVDQISGYAAVDMLGSTAAFEFQLPLDSLQPSSRTYFSINLNDAAGTTTTGTGTGSNNSSSSLSSASPPQQPPLVVSLERSQDGIDQTVVSSMAISQVLHLDRYQLNPLEDRAPLIRNTLAWTVMMQRTGITNSSGSAFAEEEPSASTTTTTLSVGGAWQINRAVAVKAIARQDHVLAALILKRWKEPRVTCSLLFRNEISGNNFFAPPQFLGIGLQVEMGALHHEYVDEAASYVAGDDIPQTKTSLPT